MKRNLSDHEIHALYCPVKNTKSSLFIVASFSVVAFASWKGLHKAPEHPSYVELVLAIIVAAMFAKWLVAFTCFRERLVIGLFIIGLVTAEVNGFAPSVFGKHAEVVKFGKLALWLLGLLVSLTMLVQSAWSPNVGPSNAETSTAWQPKQNLPILLVVILVVILAVFALGALLYFLPFRQ